MEPKKKDPKTEEEEIEKEDPQEDETEQEESETEEEEDLSAEELRSRLAEREKRLKEVNAESKARRLALEKLEKEKKDREEAELSEKEKLERQVADKETELEKIRGEARALKLSQKFESAARSLKISFASDNARETAFSLLDPEEVGEDFDGIESELKRLAKDHSYLFGKADPNQFIDDGSRKTRVSARTLTKNAVNKKRSMIGPL